MPHRYIGLSLHFVNLISSRSDASSFGVFRVSRVSTTIHWWFHWRGSGERRRWRRRLNRRWTHRCLWRRIQLWRSGVQGGSWSTRSTQGFGSWRSHACGPRWCRRVRKKVQILSTRIKERFWGWESWFEDGEDHHSGGVGDRTTTGPWRLGWEKQREWW